MVCDHSPFTSDASRPSTSPLMRMRTRFSIPADGIRLKVSLADGANSTSPMPIAVRACATTADTPLPARRTLHTPGCGRLMMTIR